MDVDNVPEVVVGLLDFFKTGGRQAMLAGGAVRDLILGAEITDWDFFVNDDVNWSIKNLRLFLETYNYRLLEGESTEQYANDVFITYTFKNLGNGKPIQVIVSNQTLSDFDISTCQCGLLLDGTLITTPVFDDSVKYKYHSLYMRNLKTPYQLKKSLTSHVPRVLKKYPWPVIMRYEGTTEESFDKLYNGVPF